MDRNQDRQFDRSFDGLSSIRRAMSSKETGRVVALDLVNQAANVIQNIEDGAAETVVRAEELARRTTENLIFAERRIRDLKQAQSAAEILVKEANVRADQAEQETRAAQAHIAAIGDRLSAAESRARNAEACAIEVVETLTRVEEAIRIQILAKRQPLTGTSAVAA